MNSMTGFGRSEILIEQFSFTIEIKSVNHRYLDVGMKLPRKLSFLEDALRNIVKSEMRRGRLDVYINQQTSETSNKQVVIDRSLCESYVEAFKNISEKLDIENDVTVSLLARLPEVVSVEQQDIEESILQKELEEGLKSALSQLSQMRMIEGESLRKDLKVRIEALGSQIKKIEEISPEVSKAYRERLIKRINELTEHDVDDNRLLTEVAIFAEKSSIDEEIVRFNSHLDQFISTMYEHEPVGRKLDFLVQELNREINTIGSKAGDIKIGSYVVDVKSELEKIREQVQNIE